MSGKPALVIDDTRNYSFAELREFEAALSPDVLAEIKARIKAVDEKFDNRRGRKAVA